MAENTLDSGRLHYFEPATIVADNRDGTLEDSITFPYDKYNIAVDLRVFVNDRYSCGLSDITGERKEYAFSTQKGTLSFLGGTNGYLTTNYTDVQNLNPSQNTQECLGVESINISYDSWLHPTVVVKFVDVRGATVMQPAEQNYYNEGKQGETYYLYKSLFTFPYPLFILKVKGFYGKGVTYRLAVNKVDIDFDSKNGNFIITVNFIGHIYGLFADMPMSYLAIAPYTEEGSKYWDDKVSDSKKEFWFHRLDSSGNEVPHAPMLKLPELAKKVAEVECAQNIINAESETNRIMQDLDTESQLLSDIIACYNDLFNNSNINYFAYFENDSSNPTFSYVYVCGPENTIANHESDIGGKFTSLSEALDLYDSGTTETLKRYFGALDTWVSDSSHYYNFYKDNKGWRAGSDTYKWYEVSNDDAWEGTVRQVFNENGEKYSEDLNRFIRQCIGDKSYENMTNFKLYVHDRHTPTTYKQAIDYVQRRKDRVDKNKEDKLSEFKKENESNIEQALGFRPSIKNIFDLMFAHLETFIHVYYEYLKKIKTQLEGKDDKRKKTTYGIEDGFTDTEKAGSGLNMRGDFLPPFAGFYENWNEDGTSGDVTRKREMWPGKLEKGNPEENFEEVKFVFEMLNGSKLYFEQMQEAQRIIEQYRASGTTVGGEPTAPSTDITNFIPITVFDIANNGRYQNPYNSIAQKIDSNASPDEIIGDVYALFALRMYYYMVQTQGNDNSEAGDFGRIEAINFYKAIGVKHSRSFIDFIKKFADDTNLSSEENSFIGKITKDSKDTVTSSWQIVGNEYTRPRLFVHCKRPERKQLGRYWGGFIGSLLGGGIPFVAEATTVAGAEIGRYIDENTNYLEYCYRKPDASNNNFVYFPMYVSGMNEFKNDLSGGNLKTNDRYISTTNHGLYYGGDDALNLGHTLNGGTFLLFENRDYVPILYANIQSELEKEKEEDENISSLLDVSGFDVKRGSKTFGRISDDINADCNCVVAPYSTVFNYINGENSGSALSDSAIKEIVKSGGDEDKNNIFINHCERPYLIENRSVFEHDLYHLQDNIFAKAYLYIQNVPISTYNKGLTDKVNTVAQKVSLLKEGSYYWWMENRETNFKISGRVEEYTVALDENKNPIKKEAHNVSYKLPKADETFYLKTQNSDSYFSPISTSVNNDFSSYSTIPIVFVTMSDNVTESRKIYLKKYFEKWVKDWFEHYVTLLENLELRTIKTYNGVRKYSYVSPLNIDYVRMRSGESVLVEEAKQLQYFLKDLLFSVCTIFDYYGGFYGQDMVVEVSDFKNGFMNFMDQLNRIYGKIADATNDEIGKAFTDQERLAPLEDPFKSNDLRLSTYMTLKSLYDKWICASLKGENSWKVNTRSQFSSKISEVSTRNSSAKNTDSGLYELDSFIYMDSLYRDISHRLRVNLSKVSDWLTRILPSTNVNISEFQMNYNSKSLYEFLTEVAQDCGGYILAIPQRFMFNNAEDIKTVFKPIPSCEHWDDNSYTYMFLYNYKPSEHLGNGNSSDMDMNGWSPNGDGYDLTNSEIVGELYCSDNGGFGVPAFGVTFGKQNQSYFKDIKLSTGQFGVTEAGLNATFQIAAKGSETIRQTTLYGQDIYKVYANNAYECTVEMMGDMQIFPPMLFQLNNIPMWKGAYMIKKVTHVITPGDATTTIVGVRQNKYLVPFAEGDVVSFVDENYFPDTTANVDGASVSNLGVGNVDYNGGPDTMITGNRSKTINEQQGLSEDITPTKPVIILTPGHYTGQKAQEHTWATRLIKDYIIPKLKQQRFRDGTSYADHVVQGGRKDKPNLESSSYDFWPVRRLIEKYGSDSVISVNVHWNGDGGQYFAAFWAHKTADGGVNMRSDSQKFGLFFREAFKEVVARKDTYSKMPIGMMDLGVPTWHYALTASNTDPGAGWAANPTHCACVLTENFFPNYYPKDRHINWLAENYKDIDPSTGRYQNGRAWLESDEGCNVIANAHVNAIVNYINSLTDNPSPPSGGNGGSKTNVGLVEYCRAQLGRPYWYGTCGQISTQDLYDTKSAAFPEHYAAGSVPPFSTQLNKKVHDCIGLIKGYMWTNGPDDGNVRFGSNGFSDGTADTVYARQTRKGQMNNIPNVPGLLVHAPGHVGVYDGNGNILQAANHNVGVISTPITQSGWGWDGWAYIDGLTYV
jgi:hypothetical protein